MIFDKQLIPKNIDDYKSVVSNLINDANARNSLKSKIHHQLSKSKLMDTNFFVRSFEDTILRIFK